MINNISNMLNSKLRFTGMASGLDTDSIIQQMMQVERLKVDRAKQEKQILEWKRDDYRSITNLLRSFKDEFFDVLKPASYMRSANTYYSYKVKSGNDEIVTALGNSQVSMMEHTIKVTKLAKAASIEGTENIVPGDDNNLSLYDTLEQVREKLGGNESGITFTADGKLAFIINDKTIEIDKNKSLNELLSTINNSEANVKLSYSSFLDKFIMNSKTTGAEAKIEIKDSSGFFKAIGLGGDPDEEGYVAKVNGVDAVFELDGKEATNASNIFTIDGVTYTLHKEQGIMEEGVKITLTQDTDAIFDKIKAFIDKYNEIVDKITAKVNESRPRSGGRSGSYYLPLTDEQKEAMKEEDIKKWEENAQKGLIRNDGMLNNILFSMRRAMGDKTESGLLASIGISTGNWLEGARLKIDEAKLKKAINDNPDRVASIFAKQSSISYDPDASIDDRKQRYDESGVVERLFDILQDNIRTTRDKYGKKGILLEKAGIVGDITEFKSTLIEEINKKDILIEDMMNKLYDKEERLYLKFAALETALSRMSAQSAWLAQRFGGEQS